MKLENLTSELEQTIKNLNKEIIACKKIDIDNAKWSDTKNMRHELIQYIRMFEIYIAVMNNAKGVSLRNDSFKDLTEVSIKNKYINTKFGNLCLDNQEFITNIFYGVDTISLRELFDFYNKNKLFFSANVKVIKRKLRIKLGN